MKTSVSALLFCRVLNWLAGTHEIFPTATALIDGDKVIVIAAEVKKPIAVRYVFTNFAVTNLQNKDGLPAVPFRSDNWQEVKVENKTR